MRHVASLALVAAVALSACTTAPASNPSMAQASPATVLNGKLVGPNQMTLYVFDRDAAGSGKSVCNGGCATNWPPLMAPASAQPIGHWSVVTRDDGGKQWAYQGKPLYYWAKDSKPGDATGDGVGNVWHTAKP
ncbi:COG4315 family predicted lipoprotein [Comamonas aquatica]|uniref:COG4315 family predicted lipoprotein n=1 Tax=Comamonas aquatica TaxID=225991 RepID=UPI0005A95A59|nr:hypothetical protein [Comamonas aquatica]